MFDVCPDNLLTPLPKIHRLKDQPRYPNRQVNAILSEQALQEDLAVIQVYKLVFKTMRS
jgi:hypothetical protein